MSDGKKITQRKIKQAQDSTKCQGGWRGPAVDTRTGHQKISIACLL